MLYRWLARTVYPLMLQIPNDIAARFEMAMGGGGVGNVMRPHLRKWLRLSKRSKRGATLSHHSATSYKG